VVMNVSRVRSSCRQAVARGLRRASWQVRVEGSQAGGEEPAVGLGEQDRDLPAGVG
jgi:hypothetical protein